MNNRGISTIQIIIAAGVGLTFALTIMTMVFQQIQDVRAITIQVNMKDVRSDIEIALSDESNCMSTLQGTTIDDTQIEGPNYAVPISQIRQLNPAPRIIAQPGLTPHGLKGQTTVNAIDLGNFVRTSPNSYTAELRIFTTSAQRSLRHPVGRVVISTDPAAPPSAKTLISCSIPTRGEIPLSNCRIVNNTSATTDEGQPSCLPNETLISAGGHCLSPDGSTWDWATPNPLKGYVFKNHPVMVDGNIAWATDCYNHVGGDGTRVRTFGYCCR